MINQPTEQIEEMLTYLFENFEVIKELVEKEKNRPKAVFGWRKGGVFNPSSEDKLWGSDFNSLTKDDEPLGEALTEVEKEKPFVDLYSNPEVKPTVHRDEDSPSLLIAEQFNEDVIIVDESKIHQNDDSTNQLVDEPKAVQVKPPKEVPTEKENNDVTPTNDTADSSAPNLLLRNETEAERQGDNSTTSEGGRIVNSSETVKDENRQGGRGVFRDKPKGEIKPKTLDKSEAFTEPKKPTVSTLDKTEPSVSTINHDAIYEEEYKERCKKKDWVYKTKEQRHEEAKEGANRIKRERLKTLPFNDFRRLW